MKPLQAPPSLPSSCALGMGPRDLHFLSDPSICCVSCSHPEVQARRTSPQGPADTGAVRTPNPLPVCVQDDKTEGPRCSFALWNACSCLPFMAKETKLPGVTQQAGVCCGEETLSLALGSGEPSGQLQAALLYLPGPTLAHGALRRPLVS